MEKKTVLQTDTSGQVEYTKENETIVFKELGKMYPYVFKKDNQYKTIPRMIICQLTIYHRLEINTRETTRII